MAKTTNKQEKSKITQIAKILFQPKDPTNVQILKTVYDRGEISIQELANIVNLHTTTISRRVKILQNEGYVVYYNKSKNNKSYVKWVGGTLSLDSELEGATNKHLKASLRAPGISPDLNSLMPSSIDICSNRLQSV